MVHNCNAFNIYITKASGPSRVLKISTPTTDSVSEQISFLFIPQKLCNYLTMPSFAFLLQCCFFHTFPLKDSCLERFEIHCSRDAARHSPRFYIPSSLQRLTMTCVLLIGLSEWSWAQADSDVLIRQGAAVWSVMLQQRRYLDPKGHYDHTGNGVLRTETTVKHLVYFLFVHVFLLLSFWKDGFGAAQLLCSVRGQNYYV